ncbi:MAG TPA: sugar transferase [Gemmatirosa sp.]
MTLLVVITVVALSEVPNVSTISDFLTLHISVRNALLIGAFLVWWHTALTLCGAYDAQRSPRAMIVVVNVVVGSALGSLAAVVFPIASHEQLLGVWTIPLIWVGTSAGALAVRGAARITSARARLPGVRRIVIAGTGPRAAALWRELQHASRERYELIALADVTEARVDEALAGYPIVALSQLDAFLLHTVVDEVFVALPVRSRYEEIETVLGSCERAGLHARYLADTFAPAIARPRLGRTSGVSVVSMHMVHDDWRLALKRLVDVCGALFGLVVLSPLLVAIALAVRLTSRGPIFFAQERYGLRKRRFRMYKFRTMVPDAERMLVTLEEQNEATGHAFKIRNDPRVTSVGRFLRRTSLDELPQLLNVLKGEMSLVGPRPMSVRDVSRFDELRLVRRFSVRPGLTCLWQVGGRSDTTFEEWMQLDLQYIDTWSLRLDAKILARTIPAVLQGAGAS